MLFKNITKILLITGGIICVALGFIGIFVPLLPTTPFLLLAATCFFKSSNRLYSWLTNHKWFGNYIRLYREHKTISLFTKITSITILWITIGYTVLFAVESVWIQILLIVIAIGVSIHILFLRTLRSELKNLYPNNREFIKTAPGSSPTTDSKDFHTPD